MIVPAATAAPRVALLLKLDTLGDFVLFAPALRLLRAAWPATRIVVMMRAAYLDLAPLLVPDVDFFPTTLDPFTHGPAADAKELARLREFVGGLQPDVIATATSRSNWLEAVLAASAPATARRVALGTESHDEHFSTQLQVSLGLDAATLPTESISVAADEPDWQRNLRLASTLTGRPAPSTTTPPAAAPALPASVIAGARATLNQQGLAPQGYVVCAAAGFANVRLKTWSAENFATTLRHLWEQYDLRALLIGNESERAYLEALAAQCGPQAPALWIGDAQSLPTLAALIADARLYLGNDTGAMHLAAALDVPTVAIFGGGTWPRFVPAARRGAALVRPLPCFGCGWDCAFGETAAPCLASISAAEAIGVLDDVLAQLEAPFAVRVLASPSPESLAFIAAASARYRGLRAGHLARQHKLEELTALDREKDDAILEKEREIDDLKAAADTKDAEIVSLKTVCDERERLILQQDGHIKNFQRTVAALEEQLTATRADKAQFEQTLATLPRDVGASAQVIADYAVHIRNIEATVVLRDREIAALKSTLAEHEASIANYADGHGSLEQAKHYSRLLAEKEAVLQSLNRACAERETVIRQLTANSTDSSSLLHRLYVGGSAYFQEKYWRPFNTWLFHRVVERYWMQIGILHHHDPKPLVWDKNLPRPRASASLPQIAVVTPSYGQEKFVERTMLSLLDQQYPRLLYAVQDGGSKDQSPAIIARHAPRLRHWESVRDKGQADAIRRGFLHLTPDLGPDDVMAWLNSDDLIGPGVLHYVAGYFAAHPEVDVIYGHRIIIDHDDRDVGRWIMPRHDPHVLEWIDYVPQETMFWRKRAWDLVGGIDPSFQFALDWDLLARFQQAGCRMERVPYFLGAFRVHAEQKTSQAIHTTGAEEMKRIRTRFHGERQDDWATIDRYARKTRFRGALVARLLALGIRW
jgi:ADP-heptose:LPS heptosyltransferase/GT2 family glycosyltransferase